MIKFEDISIKANKFKSGVEYVTVPLLERHGGCDLKSRKMVTSKSITQTRVVPGVTKYSGVVEASIEVSFEFYHVNKVVNGKKLRHFYGTEKEALRSIDMFLIREGKQPKYTLKKND